MATPADEQKPTRSLREFYQAQPPIGGAIRAGMERAFPNTVAQGRDMQAKVGQAYGRGGLISAAGEASKRVLQPAIGVGQDVASAVGAVGRLLNPFSKPASAQPPTPGQPTQPTPKLSAAAPKPAGARAMSVALDGSNDGFMPASVLAKDISVMNKMGAPAAPAVERPKISAPAAKRPAAPVAQAPVAAPAAQPTAQADDSVIIDRGIGPPGTTMAMLDHNTGDILTAAGGTNVYTPFEGQYMTQDQQDLITANRLGVGDRMTVGQAGAISKQAALLNDRALAEAGDTQRTKMSVDGGIAQQRISTGGAIQSANIAHGESNKIKALEAKAIAALDDALKSGDAGAIGMAQQRLAAIRGGGSGSEFAPLNVYDDMGNVIGQRLYNKNNGVVQGMGGDQGITQADISATAKKHGISEEEVIQRLKAEGKL